MKNEAVIRRAMRNPYPRPFAKVDVPEGESGDWRVSRFEVSEDDLWMSNLREYIKGWSHRTIPPGRYTRLTCRGRGVVMSDTPAEAHENIYAYRMATGRVLLNGLGLGFLLKAILTKPEVTSVVVTEVSRDVISLVSSSIADSRVEIICADARKWRPKRGERFNVVWHDIWDTICGDNLKEMQSLHRAYGRRCDWQGSWSRAMLRRMPC